MGGFGSTRWNWHTKKTQVEECLQFHINTIKKNLKPGYGSVMSWILGDKVTDNIRYRVIGDDAPIAIRLIYKSTDRVTKESVDYDYHVYLTTTPLYWGGVRYWFVCQLLKGDIPCNRRVGVLYLPPGGRYFGCRHCYDLTYRSCQESHMYNGLYQRLAIQMQHEYPGCTLRDIKYLLEEKFTPNMERLAAERYIRDWQDYDPYEHYLTLDELCKRSGLSHADLIQLEEVRLLLPDTPDFRYRPKLGGWGRKLAYLLGEGWELDEIKRWAKGRWKTENPREWPPNRLDW